jgi:hypothetical protein
MSSKLEPRDEKVADGGRALLAEPGHAILERACSFAYYHHIPIGRFTPRTKETGALERVFLFVPLRAEAPPKRKSNRAKLGLRPKS